MTAALAMVVCACVASAQDVPTADPSDPLAAALGRGLSLLDPLPHRVDVFRNALTSQITTFPLGSSSGAFTVVFDPGSRTFSRRTRTFGPWYAERAATLGRRGALSLGSATQVVSYDSLDGQDLQDGSVRRLLKFGDGPWMGHQLRMSLGQQTLTAFATYAVDNALDVGIIVPFVRSTFRGSVTDADGQVVDLGRVSSSGVGDLQIRAKWSPVHSTRLDAAAQVDIWVPSGDRFKLAGAGVPRERLAAVSTLHLGAIEAHANVGYRFSLAGESPGHVVESLFSPDEQIAPANEFSFVAGAEWAVAPRVSVTGEIVGRYLRDTVRFVLRQVTTIVGEEDDPVIAQFDGTVPVRSGVGQTLGTFGVKVNVAGTLIVSGHALFSPTRAGLSVRPAFVLGLERAF